MTPLFRVMTQFLRCHGTLVNNSSRRCLARLGARRGGLPGYAYFHRRDSCQGASLSRLEHRRVESKSELRDDQNRRDHPGNTMVVVGKHCRLLLIIIWWKIPTELLKCKWLLPFQRQPRHVPVLSSLKKLQADQKMIRINLFDGSFGSPFAKKTY